MDTEKAPVAADDNPLNPHFEVTELDFVDDDLDYASENAPGKEHTAELSQKVDHLDNRVTRVEEDLKHAGPKAADTEQSTNKNDAPLDLLEFM